MESHRGKLLLYDPESGCLLTPDCDHKSEDRTGVNGFGGCCASSINFDEVVKALISIIRD